MLTISNENGDTIRQTSLREFPEIIRFSDRKQDVRSSLAEGTVSLILGKKVMFLFSIDDPDNPIELAFQNKYGEIVNYQWYGDGYIMIGFSLGYLIVISTHAKEIGTVFSLFLSFSFCSFILHASPNIGVVSIKNPQELPGRHSSLQVVEQGSFVWRQLHQDL